MVTEAGRPCWIPAVWDAPAWIKAGTTTRHGGQSKPPYDQLNLALHVGDEPRSVHDNRQYISNLLRLPSEPLWLEQLHSDRILTDSNDGGTIADGMYSETAGVVCVVMTADCVPLLLCNTDGTRIAAVHAGWRGLCDGIIDNAITLFGSDPAEVLAWIGPHIGQQKYEVGNDVRDAAIRKDKHFDSAFLKNERGRWQASLETQVRQNLTTCGVHRIFSIHHCTYTQTDNYFSYRRDGNTGRTASMIWIDK